MGKYKLLTVTIFSLILFSTFANTMIVFTASSPSKSFNSGAEKKRPEMKLPPELEEKLKEKVQPLLSEIEEIKAGKNYIEGERIVVFKPETTKNKMDEVIGKAGAVRARDVAKFGAKGSEKVVKLLKFESEEKAKQAEAELKKDPSVLYVARNFKVRAPPVKPVEFKGQPEPGPRATTADPFRSYQWYLFKTKEQFAPFAATAPVVAVIDTGVAYDHEELAGKVILGHDYVDDDDDPYDENGHGTAVAGVIAAKVNNAKGIAGISPKSMIKAIRVLDEYGTGTFDDILAAIEEAGYDDEVKIINLSLAGYVDYPSDEYNLFETMIDWCVYTRGKIVVSAAGNEDNIVSYYFDYPDTDYYDFVPVPAAIPSSFTVAATDETDSRAFFSNYGTTRLPYVDIAAPGYRVLSLWYLGGYDIWYGTSFSAPIVAAAAARVWGKYPGMSNTEVMAQLTSTGRPLGPEKGFPAPVPRVDIAKALGITLTGIQGQVIDAEKWFYDTLGGAKVKATTIKYAFSNNGGFYTITGLAPGTYTLTVTKYGYVTQTRTVTVTAGQVTEDVDFYMASVKPTEYRTVVVTWNSINPGFYEWLYSIYGYSLEHPDMPRLEATAGRSMHANLQILPDDYRIGSLYDYGDLYSYPYAKVVNCWWLSDRPVETIVYKPLSGKTYRYGVSMPLYFLCWGKLVGSGAVARVYRSTSTLSTISSAAATGTAEFWWHVYNHVGTATPSTVNKRTPMYGFTPVTGASIILVDDDMSGRYSWYSDYSYWFKSALADAGYAFAYWDTTEAGPPSPGDLAPYAITVWFTGDDWTTALLPYERSTLSSYLSAGKKLFITGQDIAYYIYVLVRYSNYAPSSDAISWYETWLRAMGVCDSITMIRDDEGLYGILALAGVNGDPISDPTGDPEEGNEMMLVIWDGDGADNQYCPDGIWPLEGSTAIFNYLDEEGGLFTLGGIPVAGGIRFPYLVPAPSTPYRLVYLSFGFEAISDAGTRAELIDEIIKFLNTGS